MSEYTQGICHDGAAILRDGQMMTIEEILDALKSVEQQAAEIERLQNLADRLKQEAEMHAQEARTQRSTVHSIYQAIGAQKGDWNGAGPVIEAFSKLGKSAIS